MHDDPSTYTKIVEVKPWTRDRSDPASTSSTSNPTSADIHSITNPPFGRPDAPPTKFIYLRGDWYYTPVQDEDTFNIVSPYNECQTYFEHLPLVFHTNPPEGSIPDDLLFVLHPDSILAPSYVRVGGGA